MWVERKNRKERFLQAVTSLTRQVMIVRGARQVGKTSFILDALKSLTDCPQILINLSLKNTQFINGVEFFGRDYFGHDEEGSALPRNIALVHGPLEKRHEPIIVFVDEADRHPVSLEAIQTLAGFSKHLKIIYTGSNLENIVAKNAATGRKYYFDLFPVTFSEFLLASGKNVEHDYLCTYSLKANPHSDFYHQSLNGLFDIYLRLGGMPKLLDLYLSADTAADNLPHAVTSLVGSIEENVKSVLGEKTHLYEYEDVLRKLALLSMETLKFSKLQVQHAGKSEAKQLVNKTVGARVAHKIRLYDMGDDLSKYIIFDAGVLNYLLNGSDLLRQKITAGHLAIQYENAVGNEIIAGLPSRDDLLYWKSKQGAQVEFILKSPAFIAMDVKSTRGDVKSLDSCAVFEKELDVIVKISREPLSLDGKHLARIVALGKKREIPLVTIPHYMGCRVKELCGEISRS